MVIELEWPVSRRKRNSLLLSFKGKTGIPIGTHVAVLKIHVPKLTLSAFDFPYDFILIAQQSKFLLAELHKIKTNFYRFTIATRVLLQFQPIGLLTCFSNNLVPIIVV